MKNKLLILIPAALILSGCASTQPTRLYTLSTLAPRAPAAPARTAMPTVFIAPIQLPGHLDQPAIITQVDENELAFSDFHQWAEPLEGGLRHTLARNLGLHLKSDLIFADGRKAPDATDFRIEVWVSYLSGVLGETARLEARWSIYSTANEKVVAVKNFQKSIPLTDTAYTEYVLAQSELLADLSRDIAAAIQNQ